MVRFILSKLLYLVPTFLGITLIAFSFVRILPGDPVLLMAGERGVTPERHAELTAQLGYDKNVVLQYFDFLGRLFHGDFGNSLVTKKPVITEFLSLFPAVARPCRISGLTTGAARASVVSATEACRQAASLSMSITKR